MQTDINAVLRGLGRLEEAVLCLLLVAMILLACLQILLRTVFSSGLVWADPLLRYLVLWTGLLGGAAATSRGKHIRIDLAPHLLPEKALPWLQVALDLFAALVCALLTYTAVIFVRNEAAFSVAGDLLSIPSWVLYLVFPIAFGLMSCRFFANGAIDFWTMVARLRRPKQNSVDQPPVAP